MRTVTDSAVLDQLSPATEDLDEGTGLGPALVAHVVDMHHGTVRVESEVGKGCTFMVVLPRKYHPAAAEGAGV